MANDALRYSLVQKLKDEHCLWSFNDVSASDIPMMCLHQGNGYPTL